MTMVAQEKDVSLKDKGNAFFRKKKFREAIKCYSEAIDVSENEESLAVYYSNRSNCHYELGDYQASIADAQQTLSLLQPDNDTLKHKNLWRLAKARYFVDCSKVPSELYTLAECADKTYSRVAERMLQHITMSSDSKVPMTFLRSNLNDPHGEYCTYGHDHATSALAAGVGADDVKSILPKAIQLKNMVNDEKEGESCLVSVLFGGVGDARHVFVTLMDLHKQVTELAPSDKKKFRFHLTVNDVKEAVLARDVIFLLVLKRLGTVAGTYECIQTDSTAGMWATLLHYLYLGLAIPPEPYQKLFEIFEELLAYESHDEFSKEYPFIQFVNAKEWEEARKIWIYWLNEGTDDYPFPTVEEALDRFDPQVLGPTDADEWGQENPALAANVTAKAFEDLEWRKASMREQLMDQSNWSPHIEQELKQLAGPNASAAEMMDCVDAYVDNFDVSALRNDNPYLSANTEFEKLFLRHTHVLLPPKESENANPEDSCFTKIRQALAEERKSDLRDLMWDAKETVIEEQWRVNPTYFDPYWGATPFNHVPISDPVDDFCENFLGDAVEYMADKPKGRKEFWEETRSLFSFTSLFFWNVAFSLSELLLDDCLQIEVRIGPINRLAHSIRADSSTRKEKGWPVKYQRVRASNIPDYTGMLSFFVEVLPLMHEPSDAVDTHMESNVLYNTGLWDDYEHFLYSSTAIPSLAEVESILGLRLCTKNSVWTQHYWTWSKGAARATRAELTTWLQRLYLLIMLPAKRNSKQCIREEYSNTTAMFVSVCDFLVQIRGYPAHWIVSAIDSILQGGGRKFKTRECLPSTFPNRYQPPCDAVVLNMSSFSLELETQLALWVQSNGPSPLAASKFAMCQPVERYMLTGELVSNDGYGHNGHSNARCLGLLLQRNSPSHGSSEVDLMMSMMMMSMTGSRPKSVRNDVLSNERDDYVILSCIEFVNDYSDSRNQKVTFCMSEAMFEMYESYHVSLFRTDSWVCLEGWGGPLRLCDAKMVL